MTAESWSHPNWARLQETRLVRQELCHAFRMQMCLRQPACNTQKHVQAKLCLTYPPARALVHASACSRMIWHLCNTWKSPSLFGQSCQILVSIQSLQPVTLLLLHGCKGVEDLFCVLHFKQWMCWKPRKSWSWILCFTKEMPMKL